MRISAKIAVAMVLVAIGVAGCGVRGPLEPPPAAAAEPAADPATGKKPHKPFVLDGLL